ncbi:MAG: hypothetical protein J0H45_02985, partial [Stenotrophomonas nitritireducens]|nr:hypothetical protein [Stenotrophomonas nitritireducens]
PGDIFCWRQLPPVRLANQDDSTSTQAPGQKLDGASDTSADPGGTDTSRHIRFLVSDVAACIVVDEIDLMGDAEFFGTLSGVNGLWIRCALSVMLKNRGMSKSETS